MTPHIRPTLHGSQINGHNLPLAQKARLAAKHGYAAVDFTFADAQAHENSACRPGSVTEVLAENGVLAGTIGGMLGFQLLEAEVDFDAILEDLPARAHQAISWGGQVTGLGLPIRTNLPPETAKSLAAKRLRALDETLRDTGLRLGLEFLGVRTLQADRNHFFIHHLPAALDLLDAAQVQASGLTIDSYHCHGAGTTTKELRQVPVKYITLLHINDAKPVPLEDLDDRDRVLPGEGIIDLAGWLKAIASTGFNGTIAVEVLGPRLAGLNADASARQGMDSLRSVFAEANLRLA